MRGLLKWLNISPWPTRPHAKSSAPTRASSNGIEYDDEEEEEEKPRRSHH